MNTPVDIRKITHEEFMNLKHGDIVFVQLDRIYKGIVTRSTFYNYDADDPEWEVETTNGYYDEHSLYVYA